MKDSDKKDIEAEQQAREYLDSMKAETQEKVRKEFIDSHVFGKRQKGAYKNLWNSYERQKIIDKFMGRNQKNIERHPNGSQLDWLSTQMPQNKDKPYHLITGRNAWLGGLAESYGLTHKEAQEALQNTKIEGESNLLYEYDPKTGFKKDVLRIYLVGKFEG